MGINNYIDHTLLKPESSEKEIKHLCDEAMEYEFATVCVNPYRVACAKKFLAGSKVGITTVVGFPLGATPTEVKVFETKNALENGASEIDMVINIGAVKDKNWELVKSEMVAIKKIAKNNCVKAILENSLLTKDEIKKVCELAVEADLDFVKTSTGFSIGGATIEDVKLMKSVVKNKLKVKASGKIANRDMAEAMLENGAERLGLSSSVAIVNGESHHNEY